MFSSAVKVLIALVLANSNKFNKQTITHKPRHNMSVQRRINLDDYQGSIQHALSSNSGLKLLPDEKYANSKSDIENEYRDCFHDCIRTDIPKENIKLDIKFVIQTDDLHDKQIFIPPNTFFYPYTVDLHADSDSLKFKVMDNNSTMIFLECVSRYGSVLFMASCSTDPGNSIRIFPNKYYNDSEEIPRVSIQCRMGSGVERPNLFTLARIDPYLCAYCSKHVPRMKKCKGCWDALQICVRYCDKFCQKIHFGRQHKYYCGSRSAKAVEVRRLELEARRELAQRLTKTSLEDSARA